MVAASVVGGSVVVASVVVGLGWVVVGSAVQEKIKQTFTFG